MNSVHKLKNIEFFTYESEIWCRTHDGQMKQITETDYDFVTTVADFIATFYPKAYGALSDEYSGCALNRPYYLYRIICRFIKCNFSALDNVADIDAELSCTFEHINCPLRGECKYEQVICSPEFDHRMSAAELRVMRLVYAGLTEQEIADKLKLSPLTIHSHVHNAYTRLGIHSKGEFIKYASKKHLFK